MRNRTWWLGSAVAAALVLVGMAMAGPGGKEGGGKAGCGDKGQVGLVKGGFGDKAAPSKDGAAGKGAPGKGDPAGKGGDKGGKGSDKGGPAGKGDRGGRGPGAPGGATRGGLTGDDIVERILASDKNKDGKIVKDELPERMQDLIAKGDANKDGALDKDEIKKLAVDLARDGSFRGFDGPSGGPPAGRGPGRGPGGPPGGGARPGDGFRRGGLESAVDELKLTDKKKDSAEAILKAHQENVRKLMDLARADLLLKMKDVLSEQEFKNFKDALERQPGLGAAGAQTTGSSSGGTSRQSSDLERKIEQLQKELDDLRRQLRR